MPEPLAANTEPAPTDPAEVLLRLEDHLRRYAHLAERIHRQLLISLHQKGVVTVDAIQDEARTRLGQSTEVLHDPNQAERERLDDQERLLVEQITRDLVSRNFTVDEVDDLVNLALKREEVHSLEKIANLVNVSFRELADKVQRFCELPLGEARLNPAEVLGTRVALIRHLVSDQLEFIGIAKNQLEIHDFADMTRRMVGTDSGMGRIGGKAGGMLLGYRILANAGLVDDPFLPLAMPDSYYLRSDVVEDFLRLNRLDEYQSQKYKPIDAVSREYPLIRGVFRNGDFPLKIVHGLRRVLEQLGNDPLIVRSSSLLEDRFGTAFCGKYASVFLANQGTLEQRLRALLGAIAEVFASLMAPDPILYRREHNLIDYVEEMAVLIQKVVGFRHGPYFLPAFAGVAFSRNEYRWSPRIRREDGLMRLVVGLGTRAVDRNGAEYPRMVALGAPTLRPESTVGEIRRCAQQTVDAVDLQRNRLDAVRLQTVLSHGTDFPLLDRIVSLYRDDELYPPAGAVVDAEPSQLVVTFDKLLRTSGITQRVQRMLRCLEDTYGCPVDMEFACDGERFYVLQCRTQSQAADAGPVHVPRNVDPESVIFDANRYVRTGIVAGADYVVYVDPARYDAVPSRERRVEIARVIGRINHALDRRSFILIGPGRWGSSDLRLGVPVRYADINRCSLLVEISRRKGGFEPEVSFGTHFFQDLVEANILYLPLYPDQPGTRFNERFLNDSPNILPRIVPDDADFDTEIRVIHVPAVSGGRRLNVAMDGESDVALAYLA